MHTEWRVDITVHGIENKARTGRAVSNVLHLNTGSLGTSNVSSSISEMKAQEHLNDHQKYLPDLMILLICDTVCRAIYWCVLLEASV